MRGFFVGFRARIGRDGIHAMLGAIQWGQQPGAALVAGKVDATLGERTRGESGLIFIRRPDRT